VIDAAGAIYVIGGYNSMTGTYLQDVWVSTDGGARPDSRRGWLSVLRWFSEVLQGFYWGTTGVLRGTIGHYRGTRGVIWVLQG
jgi:hypothetical protein